MPRNAEYWAIHKQEATKLSNDELMAIIVEPEGEVALKLDKRVRDQLSEPQTRTNFAEISA
jgi:hypothetical protein